MKRTLLLMFLACTAAFPVRAQSLAETGMVGQVAGTLTSGAVGASAAIVSNAQNAAVSSAPAVAAPMVSGVPEVKQKVFTPQPPSVLSAVSDDKDEKVASLFFTPNQLMAIMRANQGFIAPKEAYDPNNQSSKPQDPGPRSVALSGIVYHGAHDWTIWLNGERVTPKNVPDRIMGLTVKKDRVHLRWMDIGNQRVVNMVLAPNQKYLLDSDEIVPGT